MDYRLLWDIHTHTVYSHGTGTIEDNVKAAAAKGLLCVGIADHGIGHAFFGMKEGHPLFEPFLPEALLVDGGLPYALPVFKIVEEEGQ